MMVPTLVLRTPRVALVLAAVCAFSVLTVLPAEALCAAASEAGQFARADIVFEGIAQPGNSDRGTLLSPATFEVERYLKGEGPARVAVTTATSDAGDGMYVTVSTGINPSAGDRWRIFATGSPDGVLDTSSCNGSHRLEASKTPEAAAPSSSVGSDEELAGSESEGLSSPSPLGLAVMVLALGMIGRLVWRRNAPGMEDGR